MYRLHIHVAIENKPPIYTATIHILHKLSYDSRPMYVNTSTNNRRNLIHTQLNTSKHNYSSKNTAALWVEVRLYINTSMQATQGFLYVQCTHSFEFGAYCVTLPF